MTSLAIFSWIFKSLFSSVRKKTFFDLYFLILSRSITKIRQAGCKSLIYPLLVFLFSKFKKKVRLYPERQVKSRISHCNFCIKWWLPEIWYNLSIFFVYFEKGTLNTTNLFKPFNCRSARISANLFDCIADIFHGTELKLIFIKWSYPITFL